MKASDLPERSRLTRTQRLALALGPGLIRALARTWRFRVVNDAGWRRIRAARKPIVFALWHGQMLPLLAHHRDQGVRVVISEHRDGELIAKIAERLGFGTIRGSSSRGAARALLAMCSVLDAGGEIAVTPDGPRGPARRFAAGSAIAAQRSGAPIVAAGIAASSAWHAGSWDSFMIPKPFARITVAYSDPLYSEAPDSRRAADEVARYERALDDAVSVAAASNGRV